MKKASRVVKGIYLLTALWFLGYYSLHFSWYNWGLAAGGLLLFPACSLCRRLTGIRSWHTVEFVVYGYALLAYGLGECGHFYYRIPGYDKIMHALSGVVSVCLAWVVFYRLKPGHGAAKEDAPLAILFCLMAAMATAGLWEIGEYILSQLTGMDVQKTVSQGIHDTMKDMMVCLGGTLLCIPCMLRFYRAAPDTAWKNGGKLPEENSV